MTTVEEMLSACCGDSDVPHDKGTPHRRSLQHGNGCSTWPDTCAPDCAIKFASIYESAACKPLIKSLKNRDVWQDFYTRCSDNRTIAETHPSADPQCWEDYSLLSDASHSTANGGCGCADNDALQNTGGTCLEFDTNCRCDGANPTGPKFDGGWYRVTKEAGGMLANTAQGMFNCGTNYAGWLTGWTGMHVTGWHCIMDHHGVCMLKDYGRTDVGPPGMFAEPGILPEVGAPPADATVCFSGQSYSCYYHQAISVVNCGGFALYQLPQIPPCADGNHIGYCTQKDTPGLFTAGGD